MRVALVVTTCERADALALVLATAAAQSRPPDELIVADDGSGPATGECVGQWARRAPFPVLHSWQPKAGWRLCRSRNLAVARTSCDYVVVVDGDMLLHPDFISDHLEHARRGAWVQGCRLPLDEAATARALAGLPLAAAARDTRLGLRRLQAARLPALARAASGPGNGLLAVKGCNQGFWRDDLVRVNGWDESITGWGPEDKELCARLAQAGVRRRTLLWAGLAWHLHHPPADRASAPHNREALARTLAERRVRCPQGLDSHLR